MVLLPYSNFSVLDDSNSTTEQQPQPRQQQHQQYQRAFYCTTPSTNPTFLAWSLLFTCTISHPSVVYRKDAVLAVGGYRSSSSSSISSQGMGQTTTTRRYTEDYDLWTRLVEKNVRSLRSIPFLGLWHRKNGQRISGKYEDRKKVMQ